MSSLIKSKVNLPGVQLIPGEPLHKRAPTRDSDGTRLSDFMMLIPKLNKQTQEKVEDVILQIQKVFKLYDDVIVFADLNLKLNILWISIKPIPGLTVEIPAAIHELVPEAKLIGDYSRKS